MTEVILPLEQSDLSFTASGGSSVRRSVLPSGVRILTEHVPGSQSVSVSFSVAVGSRDETNNHFGSTHFLEHLLFKGTKTRTAMDIAVAFDSVGGSSNASTGKEHTSYYAKVQDKALPIAVEVIADMLTSSLIDETEFENERPVILEELAMNDDDPQDVVHEAFSSAVLGDHPLGRPIGGTIETITAVSDQSAVTAVARTGGAGAVVGRVRIAVAEQDARVWVVGGAVSDEDPQHAARSPGGRGTRGGRRRRGCRDRDWFDWFGRLATARRGRRA
jgi:hypothetical protein